MRRTVNLALVAGVLLALLAGMGTSSATAPNLAPSHWDAPSDGTGGVLAPVVELVGGTVPLGPVLDVARERIGAVEAVSVALGHTPAERTATFHYPGAQYVKLHLGQLRLGPGDELTVADPEGIEVYRYDAEELAEADGWVMSVTGDTAVVTLHPAPTRLADRALTAIGVTVDQVARGLPAAELITAPPAARPYPYPYPDRREESICGRNDTRDAVCYKSTNPTIYRNSKAVARLLINGVELCTAFRVGPNNRMLTNHHCIESAATARRTEVWFNYQCAECDGWAVFRPTKVRVDRLLDTNRVLDYTLFTVDDFAAVQRYGFLEPTARDVASGEEVYIPQHPRGLPTRVALGSDRDRGGNCQVANPREHGYGWYTDMSYYCDTDGGSSGSPVLSRRTHQVIALHHFGGCPNAGVRMDLILPRISELLARSA